MVRATDIFESLVETLSDATLVAPAVKTALLHDRSKRSKSSSASTYFYEFAHATERGDYPSQLGCVAGDDLPYLFGAPLVPGMNLGYFSSSYTKQETSFSEMVMTYLGNFVRTGLVLYIYQYILFPHYLSLKSVFQRHHYCHDSRVERSGEKQVYIHTRKSTIRSMRKRGS